MPHGLVGQSFRPSASKRNGKRDVYPSSGPFMTSAQAEGVIDGVYTDYLVDGPHGHSFVYSAFDATAASKTTTTDEIWATTSE